MERQPERSNWPTIRQFILFWVGIVGLIFEILTPPGVRPTVIILCLILIGIVPVDWWMENR